MGQGLTGTRDLLEIPLSWQEPYVYQCNPATKTCSSVNPSQKNDIEEEFSNPEQESGGF